MVIILLFSLNRERKIKVTDMYINPITNITNHIVLKSMYSKVLNISKDKIILLIIITIDINTLVVASTLKVTSLIVLLVFSFICSKKFLFNTCS